MLFASHYIEIVLWVYEHLHITAYTAGDLYASHFSNIKSVCTHYL